MLTLIVLSSDWGAFRQREEQTQKQNQASAGLGEHYAEYTNLGRDKKQRQEPSTKRDGEGRMASSSI